MCHWFIHAIFTLVLLAHDAFCWLYHGNLCRDDQGNNILRIDRGRLSRHKDIRVADIVKVIPMQTAFGASRYLLVKYGPNRLISLQPDDQKAFMSELKKRQ